MKFTIRLTSPEDAQGILQAYHSAVHVTAARDYPLAVLQLWSPSVDESRVVAKKKRLEQTLGITVMSYVAVAEDGEIIGLGELVPPDTLGAVYVAASAGGSCTRARNEGASHGELSHGSAVLRSAGLPGT